MALLGDFISNISKSSGANINTDSMKAVLMHPELSKLDIPDDFISSVMKGLLSKEVAKNDTEIRNHYFAQWAKTGDGVLEQTLTDFGIDAETAQKIKSADGVHTRFVKLTEAVKEAEAKKAAAAPSGKKEADDEIKKLNAELATAKSALTAGIEKVKSELTTDFNSKLKDRDINSFLQTFEYGLGDLPKEAQIATAKFMLQRELENKKINIVYDADKSLLGLKTLEGMDVFNESHAQLSLKDFASKVFAENKLLKVSGAAANGALNTPANGNPTIVQTGGQTRNNAAFDAVMDDAIKSVGQDHRIN